MSNGLKSILKSMRTVKETKTTKRDNSTFSGLRATPQGSKAEQKAWKKIMLEKKKRDAARKAKGLPEEF